MNSDKQLAIELTKALIQNNNVKPVFNPGRRDDDSDTLAYIIGDTKYSFSDLTSYFLDNIKRINKWD